MKNKSFIMLLLLATFFTDCSVAPENKTTERAPVENKKVIVADRFKITESGKIGYINHLGNVVIEPQFDEAWGFFL